MRGNSISLSHGEEVAAEEEVEEEGGGCTLENTEKSVLGHFYSWMISFFCLICDLPYKKKQRLKLRCVFALSF